jgi:hypothetical protein
MAEWLKAAVLKTVRDESPSRVRISLPPQKLKNSYFCMSFLVSAGEVTPYVLYQLLHRSTVCGAYTRMNLSRTGSFEEAIV